ncbi:MAG: hypothetical protein M3362_01410 [Acidobacteriota bacterium]|nr:hypothetical protein [Acidobacteriota bacterium]
MSSGGGGSHVGTGSTGGANGGDDCLRNFNGVRLTAPQDLSKLKLHDTLDLEVWDEAGHPVLHATKGGKDMGAITSTSAVKIINCINKGYSYVAEVAELDGGDCTLNVTLKGSA